jgi:hypothetical protein
MLPLVVDAALLIRSNRALIEARSVLRLAAEMK